MTCLTTEYFFLVSFAFAFMFELVQNTINLIVIDKWGKTKVDLMKCHDCSRWGSILRQMRSKTHFIN